MLTSSSNTLVISLRRNCHSTIPRQDNRRHKHKRQKAVQQELQQQGRPGVRKIGHTVIKMNLSPIYKHTCNAFIHQTKDRLVTNKHMHIWNEKFIVE